ncbi:unnamed protein product [Brassica oleracea var. botrytis]|uniref:Uncharacterized protein n=3 Tax=Brassica TaxID=3705 RepID=A0A0D3AJU8_BRAOL|nr:unnamed protein product [Brassica napus]VDD19876.1 unnamed protein product [Brassica oleracea]
MLFFSLPLSKGQYFLAYIFDSFNIPSNSTSSKEITQDIQSVRKTKIYMAMELELDDDVFFADISKQISLLIMDEDEQLNPVSLSTSSLAFQGMFRESYQTDPYMYHKEPSKGTGVFIPKSSQSRRRLHHPKQGRFSSFNAKQHNSIHQNRQLYQNNSRSTLTTHNNNKSSMITSNVHASMARRSYRDAASIYT